MKRISYQIAAYNEIDELKKLIPFLQKYKREEDGIVVLFDENNGSKEVEDYLISLGPKFHWFPYKFEGHFASMKNALIDSSKGYDYCFSIDSDEIPHQNLIESLPYILENTDVDLLWVPRINTLTGDGWENYAKSQRWSVNDKGWINWENDFQGRIYKNTPEIYWENKVHEVLKGYKEYSNLPLDEEWALYHPKTLTKQQSQNQYYSTL